MSYIFYKILNQDLCIYIDKLILYQHNYDKTLTELINIFSKSKMKEESYKLKKKGIKLINYPDWIKRGDIEKYKGLYDINLSHVKRNYNWFYHIYFF